MTKKKQRETLRDLRAELARLAELEKAFDPSHGFMLRPYSKRRARLVRMFWAVKRGVCPVMILLCVLVLPFVILAELLKITK